MCLFYQNERVLLNDHVSELHPDFASLNAQEKFVYLLRYYDKGRELAKNLEKAYDKHKYYLCE